MYMYKAFIVKSVTLAHDIFFYKGFQSTTSGSKLSEEFVVPATAINPKLSIWFKYKLTNTVNRCWCPLSCLIVTFIWGERRLKVESFSVVKIESAGTWDVIFSVRNCCHCKGLREETEVTWHLHHCKIYRPQYNIWREYSYSTSYPSSYR